MFIFFPLVGGWCRQYVVWCPDVISLCRYGASVAAPYMYGGSIAPEVTIAKLPCEVTLCGLVQLG